jgi:hypothetical protein
MAEGILGALGTGDVKTARSLMRQALREESRTDEEIATDVVTFADERILAGDTLGADTAIIGAVHEGVRPHVLFNAIKVHARKKVMADAVGLHGSQ